MEEKNIPRELVESLQNGEREELDKIYKQLKRETYSKDKRYNEKGEDLWGDEWAQNDEYHARIYNEGLRDMKNMSMDLLSQSKKEGIEEVINDLYELKEIEQNEEGVFSLGYVIRTIEKKLESLTNQKKEDEKNKT